ncbi:MAG: hypothetical protein APR56_10310 [Methanosaeta sp. SDB]|nr:MAG: hypothetical protein APR56_10310 [Methanosaeta sp. SDB]
MISFILAFGATVSSGVELAYVFGIDDSIYRVDTDAGTDEAAYTIPHHIELRGIDTAPDGKIYFVTGQTGDIYEEDPLRYNYLEQIKSITPSAAPGVGYGDEVIVYTRETFFPLPDDEYEPISDVAIKKTDDSGSYEIYYSIATGVWADGRIYRIDGPETASLYYTVSLADVPVPSCNGTAGTWAGDFAFDDADNLYLSSGNHVPASIFRVSGASVYGVTGSPVEVYGHDCCVMGLCYESPNSLYFADWGSSIYRLDLETLEAELFYTNESVEYWMRDVALLTGRVGAGRTLPATMSMMARLRTAPDLRITKVQAGEPTFKDGGREAAVPLTVTVKNFGLSKADAFEVGITVLYPGQRSEVTATFSPPGKVEGLDGGEDITLHGTLALEDPRGVPLYGQIISISSHADSCFGFKAMPGYCRVEEDDETNNEMAIDLKLPTAPFGGLAPLTSSLTKR